MATVVIPNRLTRLSGIDSHHIFGLIRISRIVIDCNIGLSYFVAAPCNYIAIC